MVNKIKKLKKIRFHSEGRDQLFYGAVLIILVALLLWFGFTTKIPFIAFLLVFGVAYGLVVNFYRCPIRHFPSEDTENIVVAPADGKIVVIEEVDENEYFHDRRLMISIFMSIVNVHANWFPVDGKVKLVRHFNGNYHKAWLPKASEENEHADVLLTTPNGKEVLCRQIARPWRAASLPMPRRERTASSTNIWASSSLAVVWISICRWALRSV